MMATPATPVRIFAAAAVALATTCGCSPSAHRDGPKLAAFRAVVAKYHETPDLLTSTAEKDAHRRALNRLQSEFIAVPFDPDKSRDEARAIVRLYQSEIEGRYSGNAAMDLETYLAMKIVEPLID